MTGDIIPLQGDHREIQSLLPWYLAGTLNAAEMAAKITSFSEIATLNNVDDLLEVLPGEVAVGAGRTHLVIERQQVERL